MMGAHRTDRIWMLGGVVVTALIVVAGWFLLIHPKYSSASAIRQNTDNSETQLITLKRKVSELNTKAKNIKTYQATLAKYQAALPSTTAQTAFLKQLQASGTADNVTVNGISASAPQQSATEASVYEMPIAMTAAGSAASMSSFLNRLQNVQARAVLINSVSLTAAKGQWSATISMKAFVNAA